MLERPAWGQEGRLGPAGTAPRSPHVDQHRALAAPESATRTAAAETLLSLTSGSPSSNRRRRARSGSPGCRPRAWRRPGRRSVRGRRRPGPASAPPPAAELPGGTADHARRLRCTRRARAAASSARPSAARAAAPSPARLAYELGGLDRVGLALAVGRAPGATGQAPQAGLRAWQRRRPCQMRRWQSWSSPPAGTATPTSCSTLTGSSSFGPAEPPRQRPRWVSTVIREPRRRCPARRWPSCGPPRAASRARPAFGTSRRSARRAPAPSCSRAVGLGPEEAGRRDHQLQLGPVGRGQRHRGVGIALEETAGVTVLTRLSVDWALRMVATSNS